MESLVVWLDRQLGHRDISANESAKFLRKVIRGLMAQFGIADISVLARIASGCETKLKRVFSNVTMANGKLRSKCFSLPDSQLTVSDNRALNFKTMSYEPSAVYAGDFQFKKHFFGPKPGALRELTQNRELTEEFKCAQFLDSLPRGAVLDAKSSTQIHIVSSTNIEGLVLS